MSAIDTDSQLSLLAEASAALISSSSLAETLSRIVSLAQSLFTADAYAIWGYDDGHTKLKVLSSLGLPESYLAASAVDAPAVPLPELAVHSLADEPMLKPYLERYKRLGIEAMLVLPLRAGLQEWGTLTLYYNQPHDFLPAELSIGRSLANLSAAAINAAHNEEAGKHTLAELERTISELQKSETRLELLSTAGQILNESLDYHATLANLTRAIVPALADWCTVHVVEGKEVIQVAVGHADASKIRWAEELRDRYPADPDADRGIFPVIRTGVSEHMELIPTPLLEAAAIDEQHLEIIRQLGLRSYICVPLRTRTEIIGALTFIYAESGRTYAERDVELAEEFGRRAGLAVEKARLFEQSEHVRAELQRSNESKDAFLGIVSHELRTPVATILGSSKLLVSRGDRLSAEDRIELSDGIAFSAQKMADLIEHLLLLARLEVGNVLELSDFDMVPMIREVAPASAGDGRQVIIRAPDRLLVRGEQTYLRQVIANLVGNAHKYSPMPEPIEVVVEASLGEATISVRDRGMGVAPEELNLIFGSFYRSPGAANLPGKGLGLAICRRFVEVMQGTICAARRPGGGLEIQVTLPMSVVSQ